MKSAAGAKPDYNWEAILIEAAAYIYENDPESLDDLWQKVEAKCFPHGKKPSPTQWETHLKPLFNRLRKSDGK